MNEIENFIDPKLLVLVPVLYIIGAGLKKTQTIGDKYIPYILGVGGVLLACLYIVGTQGFSVIGIFTAITQGILCAGSTVYVNQLIKQYNKDK